MKALLAEERTTQLRFEFDSCRARGELLYELGDYEDALADLQAADRATRNHDNTLRYEQSFTYEF